MVNVPMRGAALVFGAATKFASDVPALPEDVMDSQSVLLLSAVQLQAAGAITPPIHYLPPLAPNRYLIAS